MNPLSKTFQVLETIIYHQAGGLSYTEVVNQTGLPKASVHRTLKDLMELGYLIHNKETKKYFGSFRLAALGAEITANFSLRDHMRPYLMELHHQTGHTINLGIKNGPFGVFLDKIESTDYGIKLFSEIGKNFPLHCTGLGKVLLAYSPETEIRAALSRPMEAYTEKTITDAKRLLKELESIRTCGYALDNQEITRGIFCIAAPIFGIDNKLVCAVSITFPSYVTEDRSVEAEIELIKKQAALISGALGQEFQT